MKRNINKTLCTAFIGLSAIALMNSCGQKKAEMKAEPAINIANLDTLVKPGDDFYQYSNGTWLKNHPIPAEYSRYGAFEVLAEENQKQLLTIMKDAQEDKTAKAGSVKQKIGDFYTTGMDTVKIEKEGFNPIKTELAKIEALKSTDDLIKYVAAMQLSGAGPMFGLFSGQDEKNSTMVIAQIYQGGLGLSDRDYYTNNDDRSKEIRDEYQKHLVKEFQLIGETTEQATKSKDIVYNIELRLAKASSTRLELRDPIKNYNKMDLEGLKKLAPQFNWATYFQSMGVSATKEINVGQPKFVKELGKMTKEVPLDQWKVYLKWNLLQASSSYLSSNFVKEHFNFYGTVLSGVTKMKPRWKRILNETSESLGEAVGQLYVEKYFPPQAKERMVKLVANLKIGMKERIQNLTWMCDATKKEAEAKLEKINVKVGYPDKWIDYSSMQIAKNSYYENVMSANAFNMKKELNKIGKPVDRADWGMTPQTVNAYYSPNMNEIVFPAGILQAPFFFLDADDAVNYGAIGVVIGHEMTHGFDDQGRQYDKDGNLKDWWTKEDAKNFEAQTKILIDQYDAFPILNNLHVDGKLTIGENIADLGGVNISYTAFLKALAGKDINEKIDGFKLSQRFFLSYSQVWRNNIRDKELMRRLKEDVHSPGVARVNGIVYNVQMFYDAFGIKEGAKNFKPVDKRAVIW